MSIVFIIAGVVQLIIIIVVLVKFFEIAKDVRKMSFDLNELKTASIIGLDDEKRLLFLKKRIIGIIPPIQLHASTNDILKERIDDSVSRLYKDEIIECIEEFRLEGKFTIEDLKEYLFEIYKK